MSTQQTSQDNPLADFGPNEWIVEDMYQRYLADPTSVDAAWHDFFADYKPTLDTPPAPPSRNGAPPTPAPTAAPATATAATAAAAKAAPAATPSAAPAAKPAAVSPAKVAPAKVAPAKPVDKPAAAAKPTAGGSPSGPSREI